MKRFWSLFLAFACVLTVFGGALSVLAEDAVTVGYSEARITKKANVNALPDIKEGLAEGQTEYKVTDADGIEKTAHIANGTNGETLNNFKDITLYMANDIDMSRSGLLLPMVYTVQHG